MYLKIYYNGYGYNFYYGAYGYYESSPNPKEPDNTMTLIVIYAIAVGIVICCGWRCHKGSICSWDNDEEPISRQGGGSR